MKNILKIISLLAVVAMVGCVGSPTRPGGYYDGYRTQGGQSAYDPQNIAGTMQRNGAALVDAAIGQKACEKIGGLVCQQARARQRYNQQREMGAIVRRIPVSGSPVYNGGYYGYSGYGYNSYSNDPCATAPPAQRNACYNNMRRW